MSGPALRREDILSFLGRDWRSAEDLKRAHWVRRIQAEGAIAGLRAADAVREHVARFARGSDDAGRADDLADLVELKRRIDAASARFAR